MKKEELIGMLAPTHFAQGGSFDKEVFASLVVDLQKKENSLRTKLITILIFPAMAVLIAFLVEIIDDNPWLLILFVPAIIITVVAYLRALIQENKVDPKIEKAFKTLGITNYDVNEAVRRLKQENKY